MVCRPLCVWPITAHPPPDRPVALLCVLLSSFQWVWQWQPVHHKLSLDVAPRKLLLSSLVQLSVCDCCKLVCLFSVCQCRKYAFYVCTNGFQWSLIFVCFSLCWMGKNREKKEMLLWFYTPAPQTYAHLLHPPAAKTCQKTLKQPKTEPITLHCHAHVLFRPLHCFAPADFSDSFGSFIKASKKNMS